MKLVHLVGFITKKFVTKHGHMNVKKITLIFTFTYKLIYMYVHKTANKKIVSYILIS